MKIIILLASIFLALFIFFGSVFGWGVAAVLFTGIVVFSTIPVGVIALLSKVVNRTSNVNA